jgi:hypothetical protein
MLEFNQKYCLFVNGLYYNQIQSLIHLRSIIKDEMKKIDFLLENIFLKEDQFSVSLMTEINQLNIIDYSIDFNVS